MVGNMVEFLGKHAQFELKDGTVFTGYIHSLDTSTKPGKLTMQKVVTADGKRLPGLKNFFYNELESLVILEDGISPSVKNKSQSHGYEKGQKLSGNKRIPYHLQRLKDYDPSGLMLRSLSDRTYVEDVNKTEAKAANRSSDYDSGSDKDGVDADDAPYVLINKIDEHFYEAIACIRNTSVVGFTMEGVCTGRDGTLCWLQFCTGNQVFIFDALLMEGKCFDEGIKEILEDPNILKVMHDCRQASDLLHHQYQVSLVNIFDTQVADVFVYRLHHENDWPRYVPGLAACLYDHLDLGLEQIHSFKVRETLKKEDQEEWARRPPHRNILLAASKNVMYLKKLRTVLMEKMMAEYVTGVDVYLSHVRDASKHDARKTDPSRLPLAFQGLPGLMSRQGNWRKDSKDRQGFRENCYGVKGTNVIFSHDSLWHMSSEKGPRVMESLLSAEKGKKSVSGTAADDSAVQKDSALSYNDKLELIQSKLPSVSKTPNSSAVESVGTKNLSSDSHSKGNLNLSVHDSQMNLTRNENEVHNPQNRLDGPTAESTSEPTGNTQLRNSMPSNSESAGSVGRMIRSILRQTNDPNLCDNADNISLTPAGIDVYHNGRNQKTTRRRMREVQAAETDMFTNDVISGENLESVQEKLDRESDHDDSYQYDAKPVFVSNHQDSKIHRDTDVHKRYLLSPSLSNSFSVNEQNPTDRTVNQGKPPDHDLRSTVFRGTVSEDAAVHKQNVEMISNSDMCGQRTRYRNSSKMRKKFDENETSVRHKERDNSDDEDIRLNVQHIINYQQSLPHSHSKPRSPQLPTEFYSRSSVSSSSTKSPHPNLTVPVSPHSHAQHQEHPHTSKSLTSPLSIQCPEDTYITKSAPSPANSVCSSLKSPASVRELNSAMGSTNSRLERLKLMVQAISQDK